MIETEVAVDLGWDAGSISSSEVVTSSSYCSGRESLVVVAVTFCSTSYVYIAWKKADST